jgi:NADH:ubiquinone oxidoreductase subunit E
MSHDQLFAAAPRWQRVILVCGKCSKRLGGGFGPRRKTSLAKALRTHLGLKRWRKGSVGVVETRCLGLCPNGAVTVIAGAESRAWLLIPAGTEMAEIVREIGI